MLSVPIVLKTANTLSFSTSSRVNWTVFDGSYASSRYRYLILRPFTPPCALTYLKYASAPRPTEPKSAAGPVIGTVPPIVIVVAVTPGVLAANAVGTATTIRREQKRALHPLTGFVSTCSERTAGPSEIEPAEPKPR